MDIGLSLPLVIARALPVGVADFYEANAQEFLCPDKPDPVFEANRADTGHLSARVANRFLPGMMSCVGETVEQERLHRYVAIACERAERAGIELIVMGSGAARMRPDSILVAEAEAQLAGFLRFCGETGAQHGVTFMLEPLNRSASNLVNSMDEAARVLEICSHERVSLLADLYHMSVEGETAEAILSHGSLIRHVHVAEPPNRKPPGTTSADLMPFYRALRKIEYRHDIAIECRWKNALAEAAPAVAFLRRQLDAAREEI